MGRERRFFQLPGNWEDLSEAEMEQLSIRADRVQQILPDLPPLDRSIIARSHAKEPGSAEADAEEGSSAQRSSARSDRETDLDQSVENG